MIEKAVEAMGRSGVRVIDLRGLSFDPGKLHAVQCGAFTVLSLNV